MSSYKEIQNGLQEISLNKLTKNKPNFYPFSQSHQRTRHSMIFTHPRCLQRFSTEENLTTKTLNPKVPSFAVPSFSLFNLSLFHFKNELKQLNSTQTPSKSCHVLQNRDTVGAYGPRCDQPYLENVPNKLKIVSRFPNIVSRLSTLKNMLTAKENRDTFSLFLKS